MVVVTLSDRHARVCFRVVTNCGDKLKTFSASPFNRLARFLPVLVIEGFDKGLTII